MAAGEGTGIRRAMIGCFLAMNRNGGSGRSQLSGRICSATTEWSPPRGPRTNRGRRRRHRGEARALKPVRQTS